VDLALPAHAGIIAVERLDVAATEEDGRDHDRDGAVAGEDKAAGQR
jgi:hypothetical protein